MNKRVLIITYYWPPAGGPGVQRVLKFAKYLPDFGWEPLILTVKDGAYQAFDQSLEDEIPAGTKVFRTSSWEPDKSYKKFIGMPEGAAMQNAVIAEKDGNWKKKLARQVRLNLFVPDAKMMWWFPAVRKGIEIIKEYHPQIIFSSSPPPTVHRIAGSLKKYSDLPWVADFRDPWTDIYHYDEVTRWTVSRKFDLAMEKNALRSADRLITVSPSFGNLLGGKVRRPMEIITNGFDQADFKSLPDTAPDGFFRVAYAGKMNDSQNPELLWQELGRLKSADPVFGEKLRLVYMGHFSDGLIRSLQKYNLELNFEYPGYLSHQEMLKNLRLSDLLLLLIPDTKQNKGIVPGKLFEYMATGKPVCAIGPEDSDTAYYLNLVKGGQVFEFANIQSAEFIYSVYQNRSTASALLPIPDALKTFERRNLTGKLAGILDECPIKS